MTFAETSKIVKAINDLESWTQTLYRLHSQETWDFEQITNVERWIAEAKQEIFDLASK
jgi:hypothetical protein